MNKQLVSFMALVAILAVPMIASADVVTETINNVTDFIVRITLGLAVLAYVGAGLLHLTAMGDANKVNNARSVVLYTTIGVVIILMAKGFLSVVETLVVK